MPQELCLIEQLGEFGGQFLVLHLADDTAFLIEEEVRRDVVGSPGSTPARETSLRGSV